MVGFQMSYCAVFFIVWLQPKLSNVWRPSWKPLKKLWNLFTLSIAAQIGVLPLSIYYFHQFPGLFFLSNLVIIPFLGTILFTGMLVSGWSLIGALPMPLFKFYQTILSTMNEFVAWVARQEQFLASDIRISFLQLICVYFVTVFFFKWIEKKTYPRLVAILIGVIGLQSVLLTEKREVIKQNEFVVFHRNASSLFAKKGGNFVHLFQDSEDKVNNEYLINSYIKKKHIATAVKNDTIGNLLLVEDELILIIDERGFYEFSTVQPSVIILRNSPKINLERMVATLKPSMVVADGSNYKKDVNRWESTCIKRKTPFYSTLKKGAFLLRK